MSRLHAAWPATACAYCASVHRADRCPSCGAPRQQPTAGEPTAGGRFDKSQADQQVEVRYGYTVVYPSDYLKILG